MKRGIFYGVRADSDVYARLVAAGKTKAPEIPVNQKDVRPLIAQPESETSKALRRKIFLALGIDPDLANDLPFNKSYRDAVSDSRELSAAQRSQRAEIAHQLNLQHDGQRFAVANPVTRIPSWIDYSHARMQPK
jgi:hypothetical protein